MSLRKDLVEHSTGFLPPGSQIRQAFICQTAPNFAFFLITYLTGLTISPRCWDYRVRRVAPAGTRRGSALTIASSRPRSGAQRKECVR
jgi:hypothetical protein